MTNCLELSIDIRLSIEKFRNGPNLWLMIYGDRRGLEIVTGLESVTCGYGNLISLHLTYSQTRVFYHVYVALFATNHNSL